MKFKRRDILKQAYRKTKFKKGDIIYYNFSKDRHYGIVLDTYEDGEVLVYDIRTRRQIRYSKYALAYQLKLLADFS
jgi:hypothetical protein